MQRGQRVGILAAAMILGGIVSTTTVLGPIHEAFHAMAAAKEGIGAQIVSPTKTMIDKLTWKNVLAGYEGEMWLMFWLALIAALVGRKWGWITGGFPTGYMVGLGPRVPKTYDFTVAARNIIDAARTPAGMSKDEVFARVQEILGAWWTKFSLALIFIAAVVVVVCIATRKKEKARSS